MPLTWWEWEKIVESVLLWCILWAIYAARDGWFYGRFGDAGTYSHAWARLAQEYQITVPLFGLATVGWMFAVSQHLFIGRVHGR